MAVITPPRAMPVFVTGVTGVKVGGLSMSPPPMPPTGGEGGSGGNSSGEKQKSTEDKPK